MTTTPVKEKKADGPPVIGATSPSSKTAPYTGYVYMYRIPAKLEFESKSVTCGFHLVQVGQASLSFSKLVTKFNQHSNAYNKITRRPDIPKDNLVENVPALCELMQTNLPDVGFVLTQDKEGQSTVADCEITARSLCGLPFGSRNVISLEQHAIESPSPTKGKEISKSMASTGIQHLSETEVVLMPAPLFDAARKEMVQSKGSFSLSGLVTIASKFTYKLVSSQVKITTTDEAMPRVMQRSLAVLVPTATK